MITAINASSADELYADLYGRFRRGDAYTKSSRNGPMLEIPQVVFSISDPRQRWITSRSPAMNPSFALAEVVWILDGARDSAFLRYFNPVLPKYAGHGRTFYGAYGHRLRKNLRFDQLKGAYHALSEVPDSRQVVLQIWDGRKDLPFEDGRPRSEDVPCNIVSLLKVHEGRLNWTQVIRSNDLFLGLPHNLVQFTYLQEVMAGWLGLDVGHYDQLSDSLHLYISDLEKIAISDANALVGDRDDLRMPKADWDFIWPLFVNSCRLLAKRSAKKQEIALHPDFGTAYNNIYFTLLADSARRRGFSDLEELAIESVSDPMLVRLLIKWKGRQQLERKNRTRGPSRLQ